MNKYGLNKHSLTLIASMIFAGLMSACQSSPIKRLERVETGADKSSVVETIGGPDVVRRWQGKDRWIYRFANDVREIHFEDGRVVYVGKPIPPNVTADEQDRLNAALVAEDLRSWREETQRRNERLGAASSNAVDEDTIDRKLRESLYGIPSQPETEARKQPPQFEPVQ